MTYTPTSPPRGSLLGDPAGEIALAAFVALDESMKHQVLARAQEVLTHPDDRDTPTAQRVARAIAGVREASFINLAETGSEVLTSYKFDQLQRERSDRHDWPPIATVYRWLGVSSWHEVLARCHLPQAPDGDALERNWNHAFEEAEVIAALQGCHDDLQAVPSWWEYLHWSGRVDVRRRPGRRPRSQSVFDRLWPQGGFHMALVAAGLVDGDAPTRINKSGSVVPAGYRYSPETLRRTLRDAAKKLGKRFGASEFDHWRKRQLDAQRPDARRAIPSRAAFYTHYRSWGDAMRDAGLDPTSWDGSPLGRGREPFARDVIVAVVREAYAAVGDPFTKRAYTDWRERQIERGPRRRLPTVETVARHYGGWKEAHRQILGKPRDWW